MPKTKKQLLINQLIKKVNKQGNNNIAINPIYLYTRKSKGKKRKTLKKRDKNINFIYKIINKIYIFLLGTLRVP